ncbi:3-isopropylmalate dehydrogenase [Buchnera aphidicola (Anoecia corni)]|uniref:3-isopropylmalate dehydrogenase n=1 Tax=Buchnera aphidicola (Anoecia corni) TaxID=2994477 RepID=A0AAT9IGJ7_9GAMM
MKKEIKLTILPGDGIGPEVMEQGYKILKVLKKKFKLNISHCECDIGGIAIDKYGVSLPKCTIDSCSESDAVLLGSIGGPKWDNLPSHLRPEKSALLALRKHFNLFSNIRPAKIYPELHCLSPLRYDISKIGFDILYVRELTGGIYFGKPRGNSGCGLMEHSFDTEIYYKFEIERIAKIAFQLARLRKKRVTSVDKANVLNSSILWRKTVHSISKSYPDISLNHLYVDNAAMQIIKNPSQFDVILSSNLFGDILSDECAAIIGSIGMLPSASFNEKEFGIYEPSGGSAPDIAGKNIANPIAQILCISMFLHYTMKLPKLSYLLEKSVREALRIGYRTKDISDSKKYISTDEFGSQVAKLLSLRA